MRATKTKPRRSHARQQPRSNRSKKSAGARRSTPLQWAISSRAFVVGAIVLMAAVPLMTAREPYDDAEVAGVEAPTEPDAPADEAPMAAPSPKRKPSAVASDTALVEPTAETDAAWPPVEARADHSAPAETALEGPRAAPVTITGCLELDGRTFRLKDTSGEDAPRSRSWRSGFLRKRAASIELVDDTNALKLPDYVGQRVAATGVLVNREMQARSLRRVASSCH